MHINIITHKDFSELERLLQPYPSVFVVYDRNVEALARKIFHSERTANKIGNTLTETECAGENANFQQDYPSMAIEASEENKTIESVIEICHFLLAHHADRKSLLLAVGGGITTDLAGFAACIYKRGIRYANVPTTLLAQVDAGIGGKTGCNLDSFKNMLGIIKQPEFTFLSSSTLDSLPVSEFRCGIAEMLKTFIIGSADDYYKAVNLFSRMFATGNGRLEKCCIDSSVNEIRENKAIDNLSCRRKSTDTQEAFEYEEKVKTSVENKFLGNFRVQLEGLIEKAARIKAGIVEQDADEKGLRRVLNLGHTYGHAIEWWQQKKTCQHRTKHQMPEQVQDETESIETEICHQQARQIMNRKLTHGEVVAIGIVKIARISEERGIAPAGLAERIRRDFIACGLPVDLPCPEEQLTQAIEQDKKSENGKIHLVLIQDIGKVIVE